MEKASGIRYGAIAQFFHWTTAILVLAAFILGPGGSRVEELKYEMLCVRTVRRQQAAKAALVREGVTARVPIGRNWIPRSVTRDLHTVGRRRGVPIHAIDRFNVRHPGVAVCIAIVTALVFFHLASDPGKPEPAAIRIHAASPAN
jgi:hypothetical protein